MPSGLEYMMVAGIIHGLVDYSWDYLKSVRKKFEYVEAYGIPAFIYKVHILYIYIYGYILYIMVIFRVQRVRET